MSLLVDDAAAMPGRAVPMADVRPVAGRLRELDGIRGWAALAVLVFHFSWEFFGHYIPGTRNILFGGLVNGSFHVAVFFVLSGEALSHPFLARNTSRIVVASAVKRYTRLAIPVFFSCLAVIVLMKLQLVFHKEASILLNGQDWLGRFLDFQPNIGTFFQYSLYDVFLFGKKPQNYNPFLWTMPIEMLGSFIVFIVLLMRDNLWSFKRTLVFLTVLSLLLNTYFGCFTAGILFAQLRLDGSFQALQRMRGSAWLSWFGLAAILLASGWLLVGVHGGPRPTTVTAAGFLFCVYCNAGLSRFFAENGLSQFLGRISFPLYAIHFAVLVSFTSGLVVLLHRQDMLTPATVLAVSLASIPVSILAALAFIPVERLTQAVGNRLVRLVVR